MSIHSNFTFKTNGLPLNSDTDFISEAIGTTFEKNTGEVFIKTSQNVFDKAVRKIIGQTEMDDRYMNTTGDAALAGHIVPASDSFYNLGSAQNRFGELYATSIYSTNFTISSNLLPQLTSTSNIGSENFLFNNIYANNFVGNASSATSVYSTEGDLNNTYYLSFVGNLASGINGLNHDSDITVNPSTNTITCTNFVGNASSATNSENTYVTRDDSTNSNYYINFSGLGSSQQRIRNDIQLIYNPSTNTLTSGIFSGIATQSQYADLAEKYDSDSIYDVGTVVEIGGDKEITLFNGGPLAGVISKNPGLLLNSDANGNFQCVALKGKVPVKCEGVVQKGQYCIAIPGGKIKGVNKNNVINVLDIVGVALSDSENNIVIVKI